MELMLYRYRGCVADGLVRSNMTRSCLDTNHGLIPIPSDRRPPLGKGLSMTVIRCLARLTPAIWPGNQ